MAANVPPTTWQEALEKQSVSAVRAFEKQLRASALRDREKLRGLVGSNYRDLLATAEQIIDLDDRTRSAEAGISSLSQACQPPRNEKDTNGVSKDTITAGQLRFLDQILRCASKATKDRSVLLSSRLLITARLLLKHLETTLGPGKLAIWLQSRLKAVRQRLLACIDGILIRPTTSTKDLTQATAAYCLMTSSSLVDSMQHVQKIRLERLARSDDSSSIYWKRKDLKQKCLYLGATITTMRTFSSRGILELLNSMQKQPLLDDIELQGLDLLQLDLHRNLLPQDILTFSPYLKRGSPTSSELRVSSKRWVENAVEQILATITNCISTLNLTQTIRLRNEILSVVLPSCFSTFIDEDALRSIREAFSSRIIDLIHKHADTLNDIGSSIQNIQQAPDAHSMWASNALRSDESHLTYKNLHSLHGQRLGTRTNLASWLHRLNKWSRICQKMREDLDDLGKVRWQDKMEEYDEEDEETAQAMITALSKEDPQHYVTQFNEALTSAANSFTQTLSDSVSATTPDAVPEFTDEIPDFLRAIREARTMLHMVMPEYNSGILTACTNGLQDALAQRSASQLFEKLEAQTPSRSSTFTTEDLPSPLTMSVLQTLASLMLTNGGVDLWTKAAVQKVQKIVYERACVDEKKHYYICSSLDEAYLAAALAPQSLSAKSQGETVTRKGVAYWNRTKTLFGILSM